MSTPDRVPSLERRLDRWMLLGGVAALLVASWAWLLYQVWAMAHMDIVAMAMPSLGPWSPADLWLVLVMWAVMMVAMMVPSVVPVVLLYQRVVAARDASAPPAVLTGFFLAGYLLVWTLFSSAATLLQWALHSAALISPMMRISAPALGGTVLIFAGVYQWTPLKHACLARCRTPLAFLLNSWRNGRAGALAMGVQHGLYCAACCWLLMAILFVVGVMNLVWIVALAALVLAEKLLPQGERLARASGIALAAWGVWLMLAH
jgi:predicted metal-binding membrane protein